MRCSCDWSSDVCSSDLVEDGRRDGFDEVGGRAELRDEDDDLVVPLDLGPRVDPDWVHGLPVPHEGHGREVDGVHDPDLGAAEGVDQVVRDDGGNEPHAREAVDHGGPPQIHPLELVNLDAFHGRRPIEAGLLKAGETDTDCGISADPCAPSGSRTTASGEGDDTTRLSAITAVLGLVILGMGIGWIFVVPKTEVLGNAVLIGIPNLDGIWLVAAGGVSLAIGLLWRRKREEPATGPP